MKQRSLVKIAAFNLLTLGLYEFRWLALTRRELVAGGSRIPGVGKLILLRLLALMVLVLALWNLYGAVKPHPAAPKPPAVCYGRYNTDETCRQAIDSYDAGDHQLSSLFVFFVCLPVLAGLYWFSLRWLVPYCEAVGRVIGSGSSDNTLLYLLLMYSPGIGMLVLQDRFNGLPRT